MVGEPILVMLVEDNVDHAELVIRTMEEHRIANKVRHFLDGIDVLKAIKEDNGLKTIPVVVLTTSEAEKDVARAYYNHANSYLVKPVGFEEFKKLMDDLGFYWLGWNTNPEIKD
jgi:DNA-binding NarL/FixJ family response regulator